MGAYCCKPNATVIPSDEGIGIMHAVLQTFGDIQIIQCGSCGNVWALEPDRDVSIAVKLKSASDFDVITFKHATDRYWADHAHEHQTVCWYQGCDRKAMRGKVICSKHGG